MIPSFGWRQITIGAVLWLVAVAFCFAFGASGLAGTLIVVGIVEILFISAMMGFRSLLRWSKNR